MEENFDPPEHMTKDEYRKMVDEEEARARKQVADVTREERAYRREHGIPLSAKTHPGYYHMRPGAGGGAPKPGQENMVHTLNPLKMADGGLVPGDGLHRHASGFHAPNTRQGVSGPGVRSQQDYKK